MNVRAFPYVLFGALCLAGCIQPAQQAQQALGTSQPMASPADLPVTAGTKVWRSPDIAQYPAKSFYIPEATVDHGRGARFSGVNPDEVAAALTQAVRQQVGRVRPLVSTPRAGTHTLELVLLRAEAPQQVTVNPGPGSAILTSAGAGGPGANQVETVGDLVVGGKVTDSQTGKVLATFVAPITPEDAMLGPEGPQAFVQDATQSFARALAASARRQGQLNAEMRGQ